MAAGSSPAIRMPWKNLEGKVVMVTGASSGIGRDLCLNLAKVGCLLVAAARRTDRLRSLCEEINGGSGSSSTSWGRGPFAVRAVAVELDVSAGGAAIEASVQKAWEVFGRIDALVNNAGVRGGVHSSLDWSEEEWKSLIATNLTGLWLVSKYICRQMRDAKQKGSVINISSIAGLDRGQLPGGVAYTASKIGVNAITKVMALELGVYNIRVNAIAPGLFKSEITEGLMQREWLNNVAKRTVPLQTFGTSDPALTSLVRYLIDDSSDYVTGNIFIVDADISSHVLRYLSRNQFAFNLTNIEFPEGLDSVDLNHNKIYGSIPTQITKVGNLQFFNVSYNRLCGEIPVGGNMARFDEYCCLHNKCLCGTPSPACN